MNINRDGHVHSHYCPHGSKDNFDKYIFKALECGIEEITFTEHFMIPKEIVEEEFYITCSPDEKSLEKYFQEINSLKGKYNDQIKINTGLEVDFVEGYEQWITNKLNRYGYRLQDGILSVHFVKFKGKYYSVDILEYFEKLLFKVGSLEKVYDLYFDTLLKSIKSDLGEFKPKRIGHPTLIRIFNSKYPYEYNNKNKIDQILEEIKKRDYEIDVNTAGLRKPYCNEIYPSGYFFSKAKELNIKMVYGSDSHRAEDVGKNFTLSL